MRRACMPQWSHWLPPSAVPVGSSAARTRTHSHRCKTPEQEATQCTDTKGDGTSASSGESASKGRSERVEVERGYHALDVSN